jgi:hypothetical protein
MALPIHTYFSLSLACNFSMKERSFFKGWGNAASFDPFDWLSLVSGNFNREDKILMSNFKPL